MMQDFFQKLSVQSQELERFPLIELMVVVTCIGILATLALQRFLAY